MPKNISPDLTHRPTEWVLWFIRGFGIFNDTLDGAPGLILTQATADFPFEGRFDPEGFLACFGEDADTFTAESARLICSVFWGKDRCEDYGIAPADFIAWAKVAPPAARAHVAQWLKDSGPYFP